ncbi:T9SS type A sorting domain-containing protein, partial [Prevotella sp.]|uniref:T9SS type A sorting domain-containing protein n=1 Tax=Prevotella sp. TaxID=59823 RepID=UPI002F93B766
SLVAEAPMGQSIAIGITAGSAGTYTLSLPEREAFAGVEAVWLTDMETGTTTDLLMSDYRLSLAEAGRYDKRLRLQMGGERPDGKSATGNESPYDISYLGRTLYVRGLQDNDDIKIYTASGKLYSQQRTASTEFRQDLPSGVYIIMINNVSKKVYCK